MLQEDELEFWRDEFCKGAIDADAIIRRAQDEAQAYVDTYAGHFIGSVRHGIYRTIFIRTLHPDPGERKLLMGTVQCLRELGEQINANSVKA